MKIDVSYLVYSFLFCALAEFAYFRIARKLSIVDRPNERSSHKYLTIRGGGIIFPLCVLATAWLFPFEGYKLFVVSLFVISLLSFADDLMNLNSQFRLFIQLSCIVAVMFTLQAPLPWYWLLIGCISFVGIINIYNFMDGINGLTVLYSLVTIGTLYFLNNRIVHLFPANLYMGSMISLVVLGVLNIRKKALCFAGDVGSISIAFVICFLLLNLVIQTGSLIWVLLVGVYGLDGFFTIFCRILRKEKILTAHRSHFYQFLANEKKLPHVLISMIYALLQLVLNTAVILAFTENASWIALLCLFVFILLYVIFRFYFEGSKRLFVRYSD